MESTAHSQTSRKGRADHKESVRRVILDAARELFVCEGYGNVSLRKIARRIGYTPMAIYVHFRDKAEILDCICEETFSSFQANADHLDALGLPPLERLEAGLRFFIHFGLEHPHHYQLTFMTPPCGTLSLGRRKDIGHDCYEKMRNRVGRCMAATAASPEPAAPGAGEGGVAPAAASAVDDEAVERTAQAICTAMHGVVSLLIAWPDFAWVEREALIETVIQTAMRSVHPGWIVDRARTEALARPAAPAAHTAPPLSQPDHPLRSPEGEGAGAYAAS